MCHIRKWRLHHSLARNGPCCEEQFSLLAGLLNWNTLCIIYKIADVSCETELGFLLYAYVKSIYDCVALSVLLINKHHCIFTLGIFTSASHESLRYNHSLSHYQNGSLTIQEFAPPLCISVFSTLSSPAAMKMIHHNKY